MRLKLLKYFLLVISLFSPTFAQKVPKWKFLAPLASVRIYDINHYMGQPLSEPVNSFTFHIYKKMADTNFYLFKGNWAYGDSTVIFPRDFTYGDSLTIFILADSSKYVGLQGVNLIYKFIGVIFKSTDGGKNWKKIQLNPNFRSRKSKQLYMYDRMNGIVIQFPDSAEEFSKIWITNDGWESFHEVTNHNIMVPYYCFYKPPKILIVDLYNNIYHSFDNGQTFIKDSTLQNYLKPSIHIFLDIVSDTLMFINGLSKSSNRRQLVFRSKNGGLSWDPIELPAKLYEEYGDTTYFNFIRALDENTFIVFGPSKKSSVGYNSKLIMNNGKSWKELSNIWFNNYEREALYVYFQDNFVFALCFDGLFYHIIGDSTLMPPILYGKIYRIPKDFTISWSPVEGATKYHLQIVEQEGFDFFMFPERPINPNYDSVLFAEVITDSTSYTPQNTKNWKIYSCRIRSMNDSLISEWNSKDYLTEPEPSVVREPAVEKRYYTTHFWASEPYPQPAKVRVRARVAWDGSFDLREAIDGVYDSMGRKVEGRERIRLDTRSRTSGELEWECSGVPSGIYFILIRWQGGSDTVPVVVE